MKAVVVYESLTGNTRKAAGLIAAELSRGGVATRAMPITGIDYQALPDHEKHIFISNLKYQTLLDSIQGRSPNVALLPLISVIWTVLVNGLPGLTDPGFLTTSMNGVTGAFDNKSVEEGAPVVGGIFHALIGTLLITLVATIISVPIGLLTAIYLVEYGNDRPLARSITFLPTSVTRPSRFVVVPDFSP